MPSCAKAGVAITVLIVAAACGVTDSSVTCPEEASSCTSGCEPIQVERADEIAQCFVDAETVGCVPKSTSSAGEAPCLEASDGARARLTSGGPAALEVLERRGLWTACEYGLLASIPCSGRPCDPLSAQPLDLERRCKLPAIPILGAEACEIFQAPSAGLYAACIAGPDGELYFAQLGGSRVVVGDGWRHGTYGGGNIPSTLTAEEEALCPVEVGAFADCS